MLFSENRSVMLEFSRTSTRPRLPRLTTALDPAAVVITAPERIVVLETTAWPLTVTWPDTVISPVTSFGSANATMEYTHQTEATVHNVKNLRIVFLPSIDLISS